MEYGSFRHVQHQLIHVCWKMMTTAYSTLPQIKTGIRNQKRKTLGLVMYMHHACLHQEVKCSLLERKKDSVIKIQLLVARRRYYLSYPIHGEGILLYIKHSHEQACLTSGSQVQFIGKEDRLGNNYPPISGTQKARPLIYKCKPRKYNLSF